MNQREKEGQEEILVQLLEDGDLEASLTSTDSDSKEMRTYSTSIPYCFSK